MMDAHNTNNKESCNKGDNNNDYTKIHTNKHPSSSPRRCGHGLAFTLFDNNGSFKTPIQKRQLDLYKQILVRGTTTTTRNRRRDHITTTMMEQLILDQFDVVSHPETVPVGLCMATNTLLLANTNNNKNDDDGKWNDAWCILETILHIEKGSTDLLGGNDFGSLYDLERLVMSSPSKKKKRRQQGGGGGNNNKRKSLSVENKKDIVLWLDKKIPCNCLADLKRRMIGAGKNRKSKKEEELMMMRMRYELLGTSRLDPNVMMNYSTTNDINKRLSTT